MLLDWLIDLVVVSFSSMVSQLALLGWEELVQPLPKEQKHSVAPSVISQGLKSITVVTNTFPAS